MYEFPPHILREYALLADGERGVIVGPRGDFGWMCVPRWDSDAVFSSLLGGPGVYAVSPDGVAYVWGGHYEEGSLIWRSRWVTTAGIIECREALGLPGDAHRAVLLRRVEAVEGSARVRVVLDVRAGFGAHQMSQLGKSDGVWSARTGRWHFAGSAATTPRVATACWWRYWSSRREIGTIWCWRSPTGRYPTISSIPTPPG